MWRYGQPVIGFFFGVFNLLKTRYSYYDTDSTSLLAFFVKVYRIE